MVLRYPKEQWVLVVFSGLAGAMILSVLWLIYELYMEPEHKDAQMLVLHVLLTVAILVAIVATGFIIRSLLNKISEPVSRPKDESEQDV